MEQLNLAIEGMHCGGCAARVSKALKAVPGTHVQEVAVGSARVTFDTEKTSDSALIAAVNDLGFKAARA